MYAIAFDLVVADAERHHPKGTSQAYADIRRTLAKYGFEGVQGSVYLTRNADMGNLMKAILALRAQPWFPRTVRDVRGFKVEDWSDFTSIVKE